MSNNFQNMAENAPEAGFAPVNYGKMSATPTVIRFKTGDDKHSPPDKFPMPDGYQLKKGEQLALNIVVNISELNPNLTFEYERDVRIQKTSTRQQTDWSEIVLPSLIKVFGEQWGETIMKQPYVEVEDVANVEGRIAKSGKVMGSPKFIQMFKTKAACEAARAERFGSAANGSSDNVASGNGSIPEVVVTQAASLIKSVGQKKGLEMLQANPFGAYDATLLFVLAVAKVPEAKE